MKNRSFVVLITLIFLTLTACDRSPRMDVEGHVSGANGKTLYFELFGMDKTQVLDSAILDQKGHYHFHATLPESPEFYRLRIGEQFIHLAADSSVHIHLDAEAEAFGSRYQVKGSRICQEMKELSLLQGLTLLSVDSLGALYKSGQISSTTYQEQLLDLFESHRFKARKIIFTDPKSPAAYFALFQRLHDFLIFDPYDPNDNKCYGAVATSWDSFYPNSLRSKHLKLLTLQGMKVIRKTRDTKGIRIEERAKVSMFEIRLPNIYGKAIPLSALQGKVVLLDFTVYQGEFSPSRNLFFRELYHNYAEQGFEIYQVSVDTDEQFWKTAAVNLPWICVRDRNSVQSEYLTTYNVQTLPTYFLIDRQGEIVLRDAQVKDLNKEIQKLL